VTELTLLSFSSKIHTFLLRPAISKTSREECSVNIKGCGSTPSEKELDYQVFLKSSSLREKILTATP
jgi:hypothetical protein